LIGLRISPVAWSAGCETPAGDSDRLRPRNEVRRLKHRPAESEHPERKATGSNMISYLRMIKKLVYPFQKNYDKIIT
jgi:hypothetical protein